MKTAFKRLILLKHIFGLISILLYFTYIGINMGLNKGNRAINIILLIFTSIYLVIYVYCAFIDSNRKVLKKTGKNFKRIKKFLGFVNSCLIMASLATNGGNSVFTIILAITSIFFYILYVIYDIMSTVAIHEIKKIGKSWRE